MDDEEIEVNTYILDENKKYIELDRIKKDNIDYILLYEDDNINNITIRKIVNDEVLYLEENEFHQVLEMFQEKNEDLIK